MFMAFNNHHVYWWQWQKMHISNIVRQFMSLFVHYWTINISPFSTKWNIYMTCHEHREKIKPTVAHCEFLSFYHNFSFLSSLSPKIRLYLTWATSSPHHYARYCPPLLTLSPQILSKMTPTLLQQTLHTTNIMKTDQHTSSSDIVHIQRDEADGGLLGPPPSCWRHISWGQIPPSYLMPNMRFVQSFTPPDFHAKNFSLSISPNFNKFS